MKNNSPIDIDNFEDFFPREEKVNFRKVLVVILKNWHLFLIFGLLGLAGGYLYIKMTPSAYQSNAAIYAPQKTQGVGAGLEDLFKMQLTNDKTEVYNQIEIIKSFNINYQVIQNLKWRTSWFKKEGLLWNTCYKEEPFVVEENPGDSNQTGLKLEIHPVSSLKYRISADGEARTTDGSKKNISFSAAGEFGKPFQNPYFHFTLQQKDKGHPETQGSYSFVFNDPAQTARGYLKNLVVKLNDKNSEIIRLQLQSTEPRRDIDYLNQLIGVYMQNKVNFQTETQKKSLQFIDTQLVGITDSLNSASNNFTRFKSQNQIINVDEQGKQVMETLKEVESDAVKNQMQLDYFRNLSEYLGKSDASKQLIAPSVVGIMDVSLNTMIAGLIDLYNKRQVLSFSAKEDNPTLVMINKQIGQITVQLKENLRNLIKNAETAKNAYAEQEKQINSRLSLLPGKEQDMIHFQRRYELNNEIYTFLLQKRAEMDIALAGATPEVQIIDASRMETTDPVGLSKMLKILIGLALGLSIPSILLIVRSMVSDTIEIQEDIEKENRLPILGNVIHSATNSDLAVYDNPRSGIAESYRGIRTNLQFMLTDGNRKVVAIHSTSPGEGKSFTSVNLSTILAMNNKKVVLVGTDMRKPRIHKIFNISNDHGLSTYLSRQDQLEEVIIGTSIENLSLIPAGPIPPNPSELLDKPEMKNLLDGLRKQYDYVIMDNAPVSLVTDGQLCSRHADLNIFILRQGVSKKDQVAYINQLSENKLMDNIALIINDIQGRSFGYGKKYYYYNYRYYDYGGYYEEKSKPVSKLRHWVKRRLKKLGIRGITNYELRITNYELRITNYELRIT